MIKILIAEDDLVSRKYLSNILSEYGECDVVVNGLEAIDAYLMSVKEKSYYDLICLDIMMPKVDGVKVLQAIRELENQNEVSEKNRVKIIMTTALAETEIVQTAFGYNCNAYAPKPIDIEKLQEVMRKMNLIE